MSLLVSGHRHRGAQVMGERGIRLAAGCAIIADVTADDDGLSLVVRMWQGD